MPYFMNIKYYTGLNFQNVIFIISYLIMFLGFIVWVFKNVFLRQKLDMSNKIRNITSNLSGVICALNFAFFISIMYSLKEPALYASGFAGRITFYLPVIALILALIFQLYIVTMWKEEDIKLSSKIYYSAIMIGIVLYTWFLNNWNMFGFKY